MLTILRGAFSAASAAAIAALPNESVGFLAGCHTSPGRVEASTFVELANRSGHPHRFDVEPHSQFVAERHIAAVGLTRIAIIHSHPYGGVSLSPADIEFARLRRELQVVMSVDPDQPPRIAAYRVDADGSCTPLELSVEW